MASVSNSSETFDFDDDFGSTTEAFAVPLGINTLEDFRAWCHSPEFPEKGRIDYLGGEIFVDVSDDYGFIIPTGINNLDDFRRWTLSPKFPKRGRIDLLGDHFEVDMSPEEVYSHGQLKTRITGALLGLIDPDEDLLLSDRTRIFHVKSELSAEPDIVYISAEAIQSGRVKLAESSKDRCVEIEGGPDLIVELVSDSSVGKDRDRNPKRYFAAGVRELWLIDARKNRNEFKIFTRRAKGFQATPADADGFVKSKVFGRSFRLAKSLDSRRKPRYRLEVVD